MHRQKRSHVPFRVAVALIIVNDDHAPPRGARAIPPSRARLLVARAMPALELDAPDAVKIHTSESLGFTLEIASPTRRCEDDDGRMFTLVLHGLNSHASQPNVRALCVALARRGRTACAFDLPGHGKCAGAGDERGIWTGKETTLARARAALAASDAPRRISVVGSSMGGALAIYVANELKGTGEREIERVVLINPLMRMKTALPRVVVGAMRLAALAAPGFEVSGRPRDNVDEVAEEGDRMDFDEEGQAQCDADELTYKEGVTLRTAVELYDLTRHNAGSRPEDCGMVRLSFTTPTLLLTGGRDEVVNPEAAIQQAKLAVSAGGKMEHKQFPNAGHSLTLQSRREEVFDLVANWRWS